MLSAGCLQLFAVSQSVPGPQSVKLGPAAVVRMVTLMRTPGKWAMPFGEISKWRVIATAWMRRSTNPCSQNSRSMSHSSQKAMSFMMTYSAVHWIQIKPEALQPGCCTEHPVMPL
jgi:hypothetical protein